MNEAARLLATAVVILYKFSIALLYGLGDYGFMLIRNRVLTWQR